MDLTSPLSLLILAAIAILLAYLVAKEIASARRRRARLGALRQAARNLRERASETRSSLSAVDRERVQRITLDAEIAALQVARGQRTEARNPHAPGTREYVLWQASFHSAASDFAELPEAAPQTDAPR